ncbi:MAG: TonB-dependent receptor [Rubrivivax sp.]|nr:TonB-dependent receptor [Rubrivivax sp.]
MIETRTIPPGSIAYRGRNGKRSEQVAFALPGLVGASGNTGHTTREPGGCASTKASLGAPGTWAAVPVNRTSAAGGKADRRRCLEGLGGCRQTQVVTSPPSGHPPITLSLRSANHAQATITTIMKFIDAGAIRSRGLLGAGFAALATALPALAQDQAGSAKQQASSGVLEIVVTAQRRPEKLQDVPVAVTVLSGDTLDAQGFNSPINLVSLVPSLQFLDSNTSRGLGFAVRGIGTVTFGDGVEQSVGTVIDGVVLGRPGQGIADLADIDQIEVLRGPQGMLFGKNASAGLINITTRQPELHDLSLGMRVSLGEHGEQRYQAVGNVPLGSSAALRIVGYGNKRDGIIHDYAKDRDYNGRNEWGARASLLVEPSRDLKLLVRADYSERDVPCCIWTTRSVTPGGFIGLMQGPQVQAGPDNLGVKLSGDLFSRTISSGASAQVDWTRDGYTLTSITAYRKWKERDGNDADLSVLPIFDLNYGDNDVSQFSQELRLASPAKNPVNWVAGLFWYDLDLTGNYSQGGTLGQAWLPPGMILATHPSNTIRTRSAAAFGQVNFDLTEQLRLFAGARYTRERYALDYDRKGGTPPSEISWFPPLAFQASDHAEKWSWRLGAQYRPELSTNVYFSVARGFKGVAVLSDNSVTASTAFVPPEIPTAYELGVKKSWLDGRMLTNVALFRTNFDHFQAQVYDTTVTPNIFRVTSAGKVVTQGLEFDFRARPVKGFTVGGGAAYIDAFIDSPWLIPCYPGQSAAQGCNASHFDAKGQRLANTPRWTLSAYGEYERPLTAGLTGYAAANWSWRDRVNFAMNSNPNTELAGYGIFGGSVGVGSVDDRWRVSLYVRNLFNKHYPTVIFETPFDSGGYSQFPSLEGFRTVGFTLNVRL